MNEKLLAEMIEIALGKQVPNRTSFAKIELDPATIRWGCMRILEWLRIQGVAFRIRSLKLKPCSSIDMACIQLIEATDFLREVIQTTGDQLMFGDGISTTDAIAMMAFVREHYRLPLFVKVSEKKE